MKKILLLVILSFTFSCFTYSQAPQAVKYQTVVRDESANILQNKDISLRINIVKNEPEGTIVYNETFTTKTNQFGLFNIEIGRGIPVTGLFKDISWNDGIYFIKVEADINAGSNYQILGTSQILSVPYSLYSDKAGYAFNCDTPVLTNEQRDTIKNPKEGMLIYNKTTGCLNLYKINNWYEICPGACVPQPTQANAGSEQLLIWGTSTTLNANTPLSGKGLWTIVSGTGGKIQTPSSPNSVFIGLSSNTYVLKWTISNNCASTQATVNISFRPITACPGLASVVYDGLTYHTVQIGTQCWMREILNTGTMINGVNAQTNNGVKEKYCYNDDVNNCNIYGGLYQWDELMQYVRTQKAKGICPTGWHIPSDAEWYTLENYIDPTINDPNDYPSRGTYFGAKMKASGTIETGSGLWHTPNIANDSLGFSVLPGGYRTYDNGVFGGLSTEGYFWSSKEYNAEIAWSRFLYHNDAYSYRYNYYKSYGFSVRCIKD